MGLPVVTYHKYIKLRQKGWGAFIHGALHQYIYIVWFELECRYRVKTEHVFIIFFCLFPIETLPLSEIGRMLDVY